jgi:hypothetical protein
MTSIDHIKNKFQKIQKDVEQLAKMIESLEGSKREDYTQVPGVVGTFDGMSMLGEDGKKYAVPANYAAKSRIVFGDTLKLLEKDGKEIFKQLEKVERKQIQGILNKKEGRWYILTQDGSYKISDVAADFNGAQINDEAFALIPATGSPAPFAALDKILNKTPNPAAGEKSTIQNEPKKPVVTQAPVVEPAKPSVAVSRPTRSPSKVAKPSEPTKPVEKKKIETTKSLDELSAKPQKEELTSLRVLTDDDLR